MAVAYYFLISALPLLLEPSQYFTLLSPNGRSLNVKLKYY